MLHDILFWCTRKKILFHQSTSRTEKISIILKITLDKMFASSTLLKHVIYYTDDIMFATNKSLSHHIEIIDKVLECFE